MSIDARVVRYGLSMRKFFNSATFQLTSWFPRHMNYGLLQLQSKLHNIDCVVEVHDARIPLTGRNNKLSDIGVVKPSVIVLNKVDLIDKSFLEPIKRRYERDGNSHVVFTNCKKSHDKGVKSLLPIIVDLIKNSKRYNRSESSEYNVMVLGIPNVGKSSLINALRAHNLLIKKATKVGTNPGVTRSVLERIKIHRAPTVYVRDTPGVLAPRIPSVAVGLKLALAATIEDHLVGDMVMADFLLYFLNCHGRHEYMYRHQLREPSDDLQRLLVNIAVRYNMMRTVVFNRGRETYPDLRRAAEYFVECWRRGDYGCAMLDTEVLLGVSELRYLRKVA